MFVGGHHADELCWRLKRRHARMSSRLLSFTLSAACSPLQVLLKPRKVPQPCHDTSTAAPFHEHLQHRGAARLYTAAEGARAEVARAGGARAGGARAAATTGKTQVLAVPSWGPTGRRSVSSFTMAATASQHSLHQQHILTLCAVVQSWFQAPATVVSAASASAAPAAEAAKAAKAEEVRCPRCIHDGTDNAAAGVTVRNPSADYSANTEKVMAHPAKAALAQRAAPQRTHVACTAPVHSTDGCFLAFSCYSCALARHPRLASPDSSSALHPSPLRLTDTGLISLGLCFPSPCLQAAILHFHAAAALAIDELFAPAGRLTLGGGAELHRSHVRLDPRHLFEQPLSCPPSFLCFSSSFANERAARPRADGKPERDTREEFTAEVAFSS